MPTRVAINGFGRIGRLAVRIAMQRPDLEVVAINSSANAATTAHLFKYDSLYGPYPGEVTTEENNYIIVDGKKIAKYAEREPSAIPWEATNVDIVLECTGKFRERDMIAGHFREGVKKVIVSAPAKNEDATIVMGVNETVYNPEKHTIISNASCTTNCLAPVTKVLHERFGITEGLMTTVHAYTNDQQILDKTHKDLRRARAAALSTVPTTSGAAKTIGTIIPALKGKLSGFALRVPTPVVSVVDLVVLLEKKATAEAINAAFREEAENALRGILAVTDLPLVSDDFRGSDVSAVVEAPYTMVSGGNMAKVVAWYDNEWGYTCRLIDLTEYVAAAGL
ncbi:MAG: type I glyceraldehyde-3-phosphate dehydrogenase [bacterium]